MESIDLYSKPLADPVKLENLLQRRQNVYGDILQNIDEDDIEKLLRYFDNNVPSVMASLLGKVEMQDTLNIIIIQILGDE